MRCQRSAISFVAARWLARSCTMERCASAPRPVQAARSADDGDRERSHRRARDSAADAVRASRRAAQPAAAARTLRGIRRWLIHVAHRDVSLLAAGFLAIHIVTAVAARYGGVSVASAVLPFASRGDRLWIGFGAIGSDLLAAIIMTSALRRRLGKRSWRAVHWTAYACWPFALVHSIALSPDRRSGNLRDLALACVLAVLLAAGWRCGRRDRPTSVTASTGASGCRESLWATSIRAPTTCPCCRQGRSTRIGTLRSCGSSPPCSAIFPCPPV